MFVKDLQAGATVDGVLVVRDAELRAKRDGGQYLRLLLGDRTGCLPSIVWDDVAAASEVATVGAAIQVAGRVQVSARHGTELQLEALAAAMPGTFDETVLQDGPARSPALMEADLRELVGTVQDRDLRRLLDAVFGSDAPTWQRYRSAPAAKRFHQAYRHGLLEHSLSVAQAVSAISATFGGIDRDVAVAGALLHDIGKLDAYAFEGGAIAMTDAGKLQGEIPLGYYRVRRLIDDIDGFDRADGRGRPAHHPQPPRQPRARQPRRPVHARGDARALLRQPRRPARLVRPPREGAAVGRALVELRPRDRLRRLLPRGARGGAARGGLSPRPG